MNKKEMDFKEMKNTLINLQNIGYREFVKALVSIEQNISDEKILDNLYDEFINLDDMGLINDNFIDILEDINIKEHYQKNKMVNIALIDKEKASEILSSSPLSPHAEYEPLGSFYYKDNESYVAIDNTGGNAFVEVFDNLNDCVDWLNHKFEISDFLEEGKAKINKRTLEDGWDLEL